MACSGEPTTTPPMSKITARGVIGRSGGARSALVYRSETHGPVATRGPLARHCATGHAIGLDTQSWSAGGASGPRRTRSRSATGRSADPGARLRRQLRGRRRPARRLSRRATVPVRRGLRGRRRGGAGAGRRRACPGQGVAALTRFGGYAETVAVPAAQVFPLPDGLSFEQGAAIPVNYLTAVLMLRHFGNV